MEPLSPYELERLERIKANQQRLAELGVRQASQAIHQQQLADAQQRRSVGVKPREKVDQPAEDRVQRTSRRLQGSDPEYRPSQLDEEFDELEDLMERGGSRRKVDQLPDGISKEVMRTRCNSTGRGSLYDSLAGITCHFCRQKKLCGEPNCPRCEPRDATVSCIGKSECTRCHSATGRFCRACLLCRYGAELEDVRKEMQEGKWLCPHCYEQEHPNDGWICNSSICMKKMGLKPTGIAIYEAQERGYKSVAHLLQAQILKRASPEVHIPARSHSVPAPSTPGADDARFRLHATPTTSSTPPATPSTTKTPANTIKAAAATNMDFMATPGSSTSGGYSVSRPRPNLSNCFTASTSAALFAAATNAAGPVSPLPAGAAVVAAPSAPSTPDHSTDREPLNSPSLTGQRSADATDASPGSPLSNQENQHADATATPAPRDNGQHPSRAAVSLPLGMNILRESKQQYRLDQQAGRRGSPQMHCAAARSTAQQPFGTEPPRDVAGPSTAVSQQTSLQCTQSIVKTESGCEGSQAVSQVTQEQVQQQVKQEPVGQQALAAAGQVDATLREGAAQTRLRVKVEAGVGQGAVQGAVAVKEEAGSASRATRRGVAVKVEAGDKQGVPVKIERGCVKVEGSLQQEGGIGSRTRSRLKRTADDLGSSQAVTRSTKAVKRE